MVQLDDLVCQQAQRPPAVPLRRLAASQSNQVGLHLAVNLDRFVSRAARKTAQGDLKTVQHELLAYPLNRHRTDMVGFCHQFVPAVRAILVAAKQNLRIQNHRGLRFTVLDEGLKFLLFFRAERYDVLLIHG